MRNTLLSLMLASGAALTSCSSVQKSGALEKKPYWQEGHTMVTPDLVRTVKNDPVTHDMNGYRKYNHEKMTTYYFNVKDSTVVEGRAVGRLPQVSATIPYENMAKPVKGYFSEASEYARSFPKLNGPK